MWKRPAEVVIPNVDGAQLIGRRVATKNPGRNSARHCIADQLKQLQSRVGTSVEEAYLTWQCTTQLVKAEIYIYVIISRRAGTQQGWWYRARNAVVGNGENGPRCAGTPVHETRLPRQVASQVVVIDGKMSNVLSCRAATNERSG